MSLIIQEIYRKWQKREENAVQTKSGGGFDEILSWQAKPVAKGKYRIQWSAEARRAVGTGTDVYPKIRISIDGVIRFLSTFSPPLEEWQANSGWDFEAFNEGDAPLITVEAQRFNGNGQSPVEVKRLKLSIELMEE